MPLELGCPAACGGLWQPVGTRLIALLERDCIMGGLEAWRTGGKDGEAEDGDADE